jgi:hypothetical protein
MYPPLELGALLWMLAKQGWQAGQRRAAIGTVIRIPYRVVQCWWKG